MTSPAAEDYLKAIFKLSRNDEPATTSSIAARLGIAAGSVSGMLRRLAERGLVEHVPYYGALLTPEGESAAIRLIRRHRIIELFLVETLGFSWDEVHDEAESLEHAASDELVNRMATVLGEPDADPHGAPIPGVGEDFVDRQFPPLADLPVGIPAVVRRVTDENPEALRYLAGMDLIPGAQVEVVERAPFNGPLRIRVAGQERIIGREVSRLIQIERNDPS